MSDNEPLTVPEQIAGQLERGNEYLSIIADALDDLIKELEEIRKAIDRVGH